MKQAGLTLFDIEVFKYTYVDIVEEGIQYTDVEFIFDSLKEFNGRCVEINDNWRVKVWSDEGEVIKEFLLIENAEFRRKLYETYPMK